jgi:CO dehydrogenase/acetyl-CoA synthase delta subunit
MKSASHLESVLTSGEFAVTGELGPPKNGNPEVVRKKTRILKDSVDAVNITDCQTAVVRMSSIAAGLIAQSEGVEPVIQMTCRDRNRISMQSDILGASAFGLKNLLCLTGDHQKFGNHPGAKGVFDMDSIQLLGMMRDMRDFKKFQCGEEIKNNEPRLFLGAAANPFAFPYDYRAPRLAKKVAAGADFIQTQLIYNVERFKKFMEMCRDLGLHEKTYILAGITPPRSLGMARYMKNFVPGLEVTDDIIKRMKDAKDKEDEGMDIAVDIINQVREIEGVSGVHIMAIEWESAVAEIVSRAKLLPRPTAEGMVSETIMFGPTAAVSGDEREAIISGAKAEAEQIIVRAREEAAALKASAVAPAHIETKEPVAPTVTTEEAGEDEMNEKERQMALESVRLGLEALKKAFGLTQDQFEALEKFSSAETILRREPGTKPSTPPVTPTPTAPPAVPKPPSVEAGKVVEEKAAAEAKAAEEAKKSEEAKKAADAKAAAEAKKAAEEKAAAEAKAAEEAKKAAEAKKAEEEKIVAEAAKAEEPKKTEKTKVSPAAKPAGIEVAQLAAEETNLADRATKVPDDHYKVDYTGKIREAILGTGDKTVTVGGINTMPFQLFEGEMSSSPLIAMDVLDIKPEEWPQSLARHFEGVLDNPVAWAQKCVNDYGAEAICLSMVSTDPNGLNRPSKDAAKVAADVISNIDVPVIVWGCDNAEKDTETLRDITAMIGDKKVCLAPLTDTNYRSLGATAMAFQHPMVASSPIDVNLAKQLNILLENLGVQLNSVLIDPSIGALGYGIEYTYSVMERIRLAALTQQDEKLQVPFICNLGREVWKAKEVRLPSDDLIGDQENRGVLMEAVTATCMLLAGGEVLIMRHPKAIALTRSLIKGLAGK